MTIADLVAKCEQLPLTEENGERLLLAKQVQALMNAVYEFQTFARSACEAIETMQSAIQSGQLGATFITRLNPQFTMLAPKTPASVIDKEVLARDAAGRVNRLREIHSPQPDTAKRSRV